MLAFEVDYIEEAKKLAKENNNEFITPEHVMYVMSKQKHLSSVFSLLEIDTAQLRSDLHKYFKDTKLNVTDIEPTCSECLVYAVDDMDDFFQHYTFGLETMFMQKLCNSGSQFLKNCIDAQNAMEKLIDFNDRIIESANGTPGIGKDLVGDESELSKDRNEPILPLLTYINDISKTYAKSDFLYAREEYLRKIHLALSKTDKYHICLYGENGVGKESLILKYARHMQNEDNILYAELNMDNILGSAQLATNANEVFKAALVSFGKNFKEDNIKFVLLRIKNLGSALNSLVINSLTSSLLSGFDFGFPLSVIFDVPTSVATRLKKDRSFNSVVNFIEVKEPQGEDLYNIINLNATYFNEIGEYGPYDDTAIDRALELAQTKFKDESVLNKTIELLDEAGLMHLEKLQKANKNEVGEIFLDGVTAEDVDLAVEVMHKDKQLDIDVKKEVEMLKHLDENLRKEVFGQDKAINTLIKHIELSKAGLLDDNKPIGSFMFVGPTGVGKTQLAKSLAKNLGVEFIKYDMSEFSEKHSISKMIGSPAGYVGYEEGGSLVKKINSHPKAVLLLDEIEKAHPSVYNILLQIMDDAVLTDGRQTKANFKDVILIMTSNAGAYDSGRRGVGFNNSDFNKDGMKKAIEDTFAPEFRGRLSAVVEFNRLNEKVYADIIRKEIRKLNEKLKDREINISYSDSLVEYISTKVNTDVSGARGIESYMRDNVSTLISHGIISGTIKKFDNVRLLVENDSINFERVVKNSIE